MKFFFWVVVFYMIVNWFVSVYGFDTGKIRNWLEKTSEITSIKDLTKDCKGTGEIYYYYDTENGMSIAIDMTCKETTEKWYSVYNKTLLINWVEYSYKRVFTIDLKNNEKII